MSRCNHGTQGLWDILCFRRTSHGRRITWVYSPTHSLARAHVGASASRASSGPCVQVRLSARFAEPAHALERQPAQAVLRVDLGARERAENDAAVHARKPESSRRRRSSSRPPSTALGGSAATRAIRAWDRAGQRHRTRPRPSRPAPPNGCSGHPAGSSSGRSTVPPSTARGAPWTRTMIHAARRRCGTRGALQRAGEQRHPTASREWGGRFPSETAKRPCF